MRWLYSLIFAILLASTNATERARRSYLGGSLGFGSGSDGSRFRGGFGGGLDTVHRGVHGILDKVHEKFSHLGEAISDGIEVLEGGSENSGQSHDSVATFVVSGSGSSSGEMSGGSETHGTMHGGSEVFETGITGNVGGGNLYSQGHEHWKGSASGNEKGSYGSGGAFVISGGESEGSGERLTGPGISCEGGVVKSQAYGQDKESAVNNEKGSHGSGGAFVISNNEFNVGLEGSSSLGGTIGDSGAIYTEESVLGSGTGFEGSMVKELDHGHSTESASANENGSDKSGGTLFISGSGPKVVHEEVSNSNSLNGGSVSLDSGYGGSEESIAGSGGSFKGGIVGGQGCGYDKESASDNVKESHSYGEPLFISGSGFNVGLRGSSSSGGSGLIHTEESVVGSTTGSSGGIVGNSNHGHSTGSASSNEDGSHESVGAFVVSGGGSKVVHEGGSSSDSLSGGAVGLGSGNQASGETVTGSGGSFEGGIIGAQGYGYDKESASDNVKESHSYGEPLFISGSGFNVGFGGSSSLGGSEPIHKEESVVGSTTGFGGGIVENSNHGHSTGSASANEDGSHESGGAFVVSGGGSKIVHEGGSSSDSLSGGAVELGSGNQASGEAVTGSGGSFEGGIVGAQGYGYDKESASDNVKESHSYGEPLFISGSGFNVGFGGSSSLGGSGPIHKEESVVGSTTGFGGGIVENSNHGHSTGSASANEDGSHESGGAFVVSGGGSKIVHEGGSSSDSLSGGAVELGSGNQASGEAVTGSGGSFEGGIVGAQGYGNDKESASDNVKESHSYGEPLFISGSGFNVGFGGRSSLGGSGPIHTEKSVVGSTTGFGIVENSNHGHSTGSASANEVGSHKSGGAFVVSGGGSKIVHEGGSSSDSLSGGVGSGHEASGEAVTGSGSSLKGGIVRGQVYGYDKESANGNEKESHGSGEALFISDSGFNVDLGESSSLGDTIGGSEPIHTGELGSDIVGIPDNGHSTGSASVNENGRHQSEEAFVISSGGSKVAYEGGSNSGTLSGGAVGLGFGQGKSGETVAGSGSNFEGGIVRGQINGYDKESTNGNEKGNHGSGEALFISSGGSKIVKKEDINSGSLSSGSVGLGFGYGGSGVLVAGLASGFGGGVVGQGQGHDKESADGNENASRDSDGAFVISDSGSKVFHEGSSISDSSSGNSVDLGFSHGGSGELVVGIGSSFGKGFAQGHFDHGHGKESGNYNEKGSHGNGGAFFISGSGSNVGFGESSSLGGTIGDSGTIHTRKLVVGSDTGFGGGIVGGQDHGYSTGSASANENGNHESGGAFVISGGGSKVVDEGSISAGSSSGRQSGGTLGLGFGHRGSAKSITRSGSRFESGIVRGQVYGHDKKSASSNEKVSHGSEGHNIVSGTGSSYGHGENSGSGSVSGDSADLTAGHEISGELGIGSSGSFRGRIAGGLGNYNEKGSHGNGGAFFISGSGSNVGFGESSSLGGTIGDSGTIHTRKSVVGSDTGFGGGIVGDQDHGYSTGSASANENGNHESGGAFVISGGGSKVVDEGSSSAGSSSGRQSGGTLGLGFGHRGSAKSITRSGSRFESGIVGGQVYGHDKKSASSNEKVSHGSEGHNIVSGTGSSYGHGENSGSGSVSGGSADLTAGHEISGELGTGSSGSFRRRIAGGLGSNHRGRYGSWSNGYEFGKYRGKSGYEGAHGSTWHHGFHGAKRPELSGFESSTVSGAGEGTYDGRGSGYGARHRGHIRYSSTPSWW